MESKERTTKEDEKSASQGNGKAKKKRKRRRRFADYPSYCYDEKSYVSSSGLRQAQEKIMIRKRDGSGTETTYQTETPKVVSVPSSFNERFSSLQVFISSIFGPFDPFFLEVGRSATKSRLLTERSYARSEPFDVKNILRPPNLNDLQSRARKRLLDGIWISVPARVLSFLAAYEIFPFLARFLESFVTMQPEQLDEITSKFSPGISILYGTFVSLTLSILYNRQREIQDNVALETSLLSYITRLSLDLFKDDIDRAIESCQASADQIRTLVRSSRGTELMLLMYSDPYARILETVDSFEFEAYEEEKKINNGLVATCRDALRDVIKIRASRLSDESLALPPTHFLILNLLTLLILLGYTISILPTVDRSGNVSNESSILFGLLTTIYYVFYNFANDLNAPFDGVYQVRRSCAASHLLGLKWLLVNHPVVGGEVDFEELDEEESGILVRSPGLGDMWFERGEIFVDSKIPEDSLSVQRESMVE